MNAKPGKKTHVLDTSVILHDAQCVLSFAEHDVVIPITVLEELDRFKRGTDDKALQTREFARILNEISERGNIYANGAIIDPKVPDSGKLRIVNDRKIKVKNRREAREEASQIFGSSSNDNRILTTAAKLADQGLSGQVILVTNDNMLRVKARSAYGIVAQEYLRAAVEDLKSISVDGRELGVDDKIISMLNNDIAVPRTDFLIEEPLPNQYFILKGKGSKTSCLACFDPNDGAMHCVKNVESAFGVRPRNAEQAFALHAVLNERVTLVVLNGKAGTGKTLIAIAGALRQKSNFRKILVARPLVSLSNKDIGYLPGEVKDKIGPHMQAIWDNFEFVQHQFDEGSPDRKKIDEVKEKDKICVLPLAFIRGRSFAKNIIIVDEGQNLTPIEVKTIVTRAGEGTKIIFTGDIFQIDNPYLNAETNGLSYLIEKMRRHRVEFFAHVNLKKGERSHMAEIAANVL